MLPTRTALNSRLWTDEYQDILRGLLPESRGQKFNQMSLAAQNGTIQIVRVFYRAMAPTLRFFCVGYNNL
jgi:hypothetical protein